MILYEEILAHLEREVLAFRERRGDKSVVFLDGLGVNAPAHLPVLAALGWGDYRVTAVSASCVSLLLAQAHHLGLMRVSLSDFAKEWDAWNREGHGVVWGVSAIRCLWRVFASRMGVDVKAPFSPNGFLASFRRVVKEEMLSRKLSELPASLGFLLWDADSNQVVCAGAEHPELKEMTVADVVCAAPAIPSVFGWHEWRGRRLGDAAVAPGLRAWVTNLRHSADWCLMCGYGPARTKDRATWVQVVPYRWRAASFLVGMAKWCLNMRNKTVEMLCAKGAEGLGKCPNGGGRGHLDRGHFEDT